MVDLRWAGILLGVPRTIWKGALSFGLVNIPVGLYPATSDKSIHFNQFEEGTSDRIRYKKVNERTGEEVPQDRIVKRVRPRRRRVRHPHRGGARVGRAEEVAPDRDLRLRRAWSTSTPSSSGPATTWRPRARAPTRPMPCCAGPWPRPDGSAIATLVMRNKEYLVAIRPEDDALALHTMYFSDEVRAPGRDLELPETGDVSDRELSMAQLLIESMESEWDPARFHDTHREKVEALIEEKRQGHEIVIQEGPEPAAKVVDLMEALNASIAAAAKPGAEAKSRQAATAAKKTHGQARRPGQEGGQGHQGSPPGPRPPPAARLPERSSARGRPIALLAHVPPATRCARYTE